MLTPAEIGAILAVTDSVPAGRSLYGTSFHVHREGGKSYLLTAWHVLEALDDAMARATIADRTVLHRLVPPPKQYANDLALIEVAALPEEIGVLPLTDEIPRNLSVEIRGYDPNLADPTEYRLKPILASVAGGVGFLSQNQRLGSHGLGINLGTDEPIPNGFSGGPVFDPESHGVIGVTTSRQAKDQGDAVRSMGVGLLLDHLDGKAAPERLMWNQVITQIQEPLRQIPPIRPARAHSLSGTLHHALVAYLVMLWVIAAGSIWVAYSNDPYAWRLQFAYPLGNPNNSQPVGSMIEIAFTLIFASVAYAMIVWHFSEDFRRLIHCVGNPRAAWSILKAPGSGVCCLGGLLFLATLWGLWTYHEQTGPSDLKTWAEEALVGNKKKLNQAHIDELKKELASDPTPLYRHTYREYLPYSTVNFALIAVPLCVVLATGATRDIVALLDLSGIIRRDLEKSLQYKDAREWFYLARVIRGSFQSYRHCTEQVINRSLSTFALFSVLAVFHVITSNLAESAFGYALFAAVLIFVGPIVCILIALFGYQRQYFATERALQESHSVSAHERETALAQFRNEYREAAWRALWADRLTLVGTIVYGVLVIALVCHSRWR